MPGAPGPICGVLDLVCWFSDTFMAKRLQPEDVTIPRKNTKIPTNPRRPGPRSPEARPAAMRLATLAMAWMEQDRQLRVRQREELRRALATAADFRGWAATGADPMASAIKDVKSLTKAGSHFLAKDLEKELEDKKNEVLQLQKVADSMNRLADTESWENPVEVSYSHTVREGDGLGTRTQTLTLVDAGEARDAAATIEKKLVNWEKLRVLMLEDLKQRRRQVDEMEEGIAAFAESSRGVVDDVLAILH